MNWTNLQRTLEDYTQFLEEAVKNNMPSYYELKDKISFHLQVGDTYFEIEFNAPEYWKYANYGRGPGKFPPIDKIEEWIKRRKITPLPSRSGRIPSRPQLAYLIARKISLEGFKGSGFLEKGLDEQKDYWEDRIATAVGEDIQREITDWLSPVRGETII